MYGFDFELPVVNVATRRAVPAFTYFPPQEQALKGLYSRVYRDGYVMEAGANPATCRAHINSYIHEAILLAMSKLPPGLTLAPWAAFPVELPTDAAQWPRDLHTFGCRPSLNAYRREEAAPEISALRHPFRYAGFHIHFSGSTLVSRAHRERAIADLIARALDAVVGIPYAYLFDHPSEAMRRQYYGRAGEYRLPTHKDNYGDALGIEYRTLGPAVVNSAPLVTLLFGLTQTAVGVAENATRASNHWLHDKRRMESVRRAIDRCQVPEELIVTTDTSPSFNPLIAKAIKDTGAMHKFVMPYRHYDAHAGWTEWAEFMFGHDLLHPTKKKLPSGAIMSGEVQIEYEDPDEFHDDDDDYDYDEEDD